MSNISLQYRIFVPLSLMPALMAFMHLVQSELTSPLRARLLSDPAGADQGQDTGKTPNETEALSVLRGSENKKVFLLGAPGSGKSTLLRELAKHSWVAPERIGLEEAHLPLIVPLRQLAGAEGPFEDRLCRVLGDELSLTHRLPGRFLSAWPKQTNSRWLLLFDGLDEVSEHLQPRFGQWFRGLLKTLEAHPIVIVTRSSIDKTDVARLFPELHHFVRYELLPLSVAQRNSFAADWFGQNASQFYKQFESLCAGDLRGNPLLLTIAAKVYAEYSKLPERQSVLYDEFVSIWLREADHRGLRVQLEERIHKLTRSTLAELAKMMTFDSSDLSEARVSREAARYLGKMLQIAENEALQDGIHFVRAVAQQSGVFIRHGKTYDFIHPTFREYFAACALESNSKRELYALHLAVDFLWSHERWYEVMLFLLSILSDEPRISDHLVQRVFRKSRWQRAFRIRSDQRIAALLFVAECLIRGVAVDAQTRVEIVKELRRLGNDPRVASDRRVVILSWLGELGYASEAAAALIRFAVDEKTRREVRQAALGSLFGLNRAYALFVSAHCDIPPLGFQSVAHEAMLMAGLSDELAPLMRDESIEPSLRNAVVIYLSVNDQHSLLAVARDVQVPLEQRSLAALLFIDKISEQELLDAARDDKIYTDLHDPLSELLDRQEASGQQEDDRDKHHAVICKLARFVLRDPERADQLLSRGDDSRDADRRLIKLLRNSLSTRRL